MKTHTACVSSMSASVVECPTDAGEGPCNLGCALFSGEFYSTRGTFTKYSDKCLPHGPRRVSGVGNGSGKNSPKSWRNAD